MWRFLQKCNEQDSCLNVRITIPTALTFIRIILTPIIVIAMLYALWGVAFFLFLAAIITDMLDGWIARAWNQQSFFGACLDPVADKVLLVSCFATLAFTSTPLFSIPLWFVYGVLIKELLLIVGAVVLIWLEGRVVIRPTLLGKATALVQMLFIVWLFACYFFCWVPIKTYFFMLSLLFCLVLASLLHYGMIGFWILQRKSTQ